MSVEENNQAHEIWTKHYETEYQKLLNEQSKNCNDKHSPTFIETLKKELVAEMDVLSQI
jgi:hypothetical protein